MKKIFLFFVIIICFWFIAGFLGVLVGPVKIKLGNLFFLSDTQKSIILMIRLPRVLVGFLVGGILSVAGVCFQGVLRNPLAEPYVLGVSAGAGLGMSLVVFFDKLFTTFYLMPIGALIGSLLVIGLLYLIVNTSYQPKVMHYIFAGIILNAFFSAITLFIIYFSGKKLQSIMFWLMGDLSKTSVWLILILFIFSLPMMIFLYFLAPKLDILAIGDEWAITTGVSAKDVRMQVLLIASILTAFAVVAGGVIGFVGLVIPHIIRIIVSARFKILIPGSFLLGGGFLVFADMVARSIIPGIELPVGVITAMVGAPFFLWIFLKKLKTL